MVPQHRIATKGSRNATKVVSQPLDLGTHHSDEVSSEEENVRCGIPECLASLPENRGISGWPGMKVGGISDSERRDGNRPICNGNRTMDGPNRWANASCAGEAHRPARMIQESLEMQAKLAAC